MYLYRSAIDDVSCHFLLFLEVYTFGNDVISREHNDSLLNTVYILHHTDVMPVDGKILAWSMFTYKLGHVSCQIWRPINEQTKYQLIGQNVYNVTHTGVSHWMVTDDQQITFDLGDMIGLYFEDENPIPFSKHTANNCSHPTLFVREHGIPEVGSTYNFRTHRDGWNPCRIYSLQLHFETKSSKCLTIAFYLMHVIMQFFSSYYHILSIHKLVILQRNEQRNHEKLFINCTICTSTFH